LRLPDYNVSENASGVIFGVEPIIYMLSTFAAPYIVPNWVPYRVTLILSLWMLGFSTLILAPFFEDKNLIALVSGLAFSGFFSGLLAIPNFPEMIEGLKEVHPDCDEDQANSLLSGMYNAIFGLGQVFGPLLGASLYEVVGFRMTMIYMGGLAMSFGLLYFVAAQGWSAFAEMCRNYKNRDSRPRTPSVSSMSTYRKRVTAMRYSRVFRGSMVSSRSRKSNTQYGARVAQPVPRAQSTEIAADKGFGSSLKLYADIENE